MPVTQIYNGIVLPDYRPLVSRTRLLFVGRVEHVKGVATLLESMAAIIKSVPTAHLDIVGDGAARGELERYVDDHGLTENVAFHGWLDEAAVTDRYAATTLVIVPSIWPENLPTVCIEALAVARPIVATRTAGLAELVDPGRTGSLVEPQRADELAEAIIETAHRDRPRRDVGRGAQVGRRVRHRYIRGGVARTL